ALFEDDVKDQGVGSFLEIQSGDYNTMLPVPYWTWDQKKDEITRKLSELRNTREIMFSWPLLKDRIANCQAFISGKYLEISPTLIPIEEFGAFHRANHRILMSATTQDDAFFIKGLGLEIDSIINPLTNPDLKWSGEKMIIIPSLLDKN